MMKFNAILNKINKVFSSCESQPQIDVARRYSLMLTDRFSNEISENKVSLIVEISNQYYEQLNKRGVYRR